MNIEPQLRLSSGETLNIPERLHAFMILEKAFDPTAPEIEGEDHSVVSIPDLSEEHLHKGTLALRTAYALQRDDERCDESVVYICLYADWKAAALAEAGDQESAFDILLDALELGNSAFSSVPPSVARKIADQVILQSEQVIQICSLSGSIQVLASRVGSLLRALEIALTFWEPEFISILQRIKKDMEIIFSDLGSELSQDKARKIQETAMSLKKDVHKQTRHRTGIHSETLRQLVEAVLDMFQQELLLTAFATYTSDGLNSEIIQHQAKLLVEKVEKRLRSLIAKKYQQQFGKSWVQHISSKFRPMYERWQRYRQKDQSAFKMYNDYAPELLDYALIEDLKDLIVAQWQLFRDVFDFGYQDRNRAVFLDKISQIISVRNALAHHRTPPENEVMRTRVLCTDILLALDKSGETSH